jgi:hypothetical protein
MALKEHDFIRQTLERYTNCIKNKKLHGEIYSKDMDTHLDIALDAVRTASANWEEVQRKLTSEW